MRNVLSRRARLGQPRLAPPVRSRQVARDFGVVVLIAAVLIGAAGFFPQPSLQPRPVTPTPDAPAVAAVPTPAPSTTATQASERPEASENQPTPTAQTGAVYAPCDEECLVRLPSSQAALAVLSETGVTPSYDGGEFLWTLLPDSLMEAFSAADIPVRILQRSAVSPPLFIARVPAGVDESPVRDLGAILDKLDNQFILSADDMPPYLLDLAELGIAVEKFPPPGVVAPANKPAFGDPWDSAEAVSAAEIEQSIRDLQSIDGDGDGGLGTRHYATPGNVEAADYLFKRLLAYGIPTRYDDFIADHGRLAMNVVGEIPGRDPSKIYLLTAHFDSIAADTGDPSLAPGALDNATGVATLLEVARLYSGFELPHPVHIVFLDVEEVGLQGATVFADRASRNEIPYAVAMNIDSVGASALPSNQLYVNAIGGAIFIQEFLVSLNDVNSGLGIELIALQNTAIKSDESRLNDAGIPTVLLASVLFGDPSINQSDDTIDQVDPFRVLRITQLVILALGAMVINGVG